jgi:hypothetical protein
VQRGFNPQNKFPAEFFCSQRFGQLTAIRIQNLHPLLDEPVCWVSPRVFDYRNADTVWMSLAEVNVVWKSRHDGAANVAGNNHTSFRSRGDAQNLSLKFIEELTAQPGDALLVIIANLFQLAQHIGVIFDNHRRSLPITSA